MTIDEIKARAAMMHASAANMKRTSESERMRGYYDGVLDGLDYMSDLIKRLENTQEEETRKRQGLS